MFTKELTENNELCLYLNRHLIFKLSMSTGQTFVFDDAAYEKYNTLRHSDLEIQDPGKFITVSAKVRFKLTDDGGRINGVFSGYRPNHVFEYKDNGKMNEAYMGDLQFSEPEKLELGKAYQVSVRFPLFQRIERFLNIGRTWWIHEGIRVVGEAQIIGFSAHESLDKDG